MTIGIWFVLNFTTFTYLLNISSYHCAKKRWRKKHLIWSSCTSHRTTEFIAKKNQLCFHEQQVTHPSREEKNKSTNNRNALHAILLISKISILCFFFILKSSCFLCAMVCRDRYHLWTPGNSFSLPHLIIFCILLRCTYFCQQKTNCYNIYCALKTINIFVFYFAHCWFHSRARRFKISSNLVFPKTIQISILLQR